MLDARGKDVPLDRASPFKPWHEQGFLFLLPFLLYAGSLHYGLVYFDDDTYYLLNGSLQGGAPGGFWALWKEPFCGVYAPLTQLTLWIDLALFGTDHWWGPRLHGLLWFGVGTLAVRALVARLTGRREWAFWVALGYALHPVCATSTLWLAERKNLVCFALSFWSIERYLAARINPEIFRRALLAALLLAILALLAKAHAVAIPGILLACELILEEGSWPRRMRCLAPFLLAGVFTIFTLSAVSGHLSGPLLGGSRPAVIASDGPIVLRYLGYAIAPVNLPFLNAVDELSADSAWGWGAWALVGVLITGSLAFTRQQRLLACAWLLGFAALAPALNLVAQPLPMADHYLHWALPGWLLVLLLLVEALGVRFKAGAVWPVRGVLAGLALCWAGLTLMRVPDFRSDAALFGASVAKEPRAGWAWSRYALALANGRDGPSGDVNAGVAASGALECADARRIVPETLAWVIQEAVLECFRREGAAQAWELFERESVRFAEPLGPLGVRHLRAYVAAHTDRPQEALAMLGEHFRPEYEPVVAKLRELCRAGAILPGDVRVSRIQAGQAVTGPLLVLDLPGADAFDRASARKFSLEILYILARANLTAGDVERAFDVAAVLVNMEPEYPPGRAVLAEVYERLGLPSAAERVRGGPRS